MPTLVFAQVPDTTFKPLTYIEDSTKTKDSTKVKVDSVTVKLAPGAVKEKVIYTAKDSIRFDVVNQLMYLFGTANVKYKDIELSADYIQVDMKTNLVAAWGMPDSVGNIKNRPNFKQGATAFDADTMRYNFNSKRGKISNVVTVEGEGFIHGRIVKKDSSDNVFIRHGLYTTCSLDHPHFAIKTGKLKIVKDKQIVTGPAYLSIENVPTPLAVPFGFFPNKKGRSSGIVVPTYGESPVFGFFIRDGGYYLGLSDKFDLTLLADVYSRGSFGVKAVSQYAKRYKYSGSIDLRFSQFVNGDRFFKGIDGYNFSVNNDYFFRWSHTQNQKARPGVSFSANVNAGTSNYNSFNSQNPTLILTNTFVSSVAYSLQKSWYSLTLNVGHNQNTQTRDVNITLPEGQFNVNRFFPLKRKKQVGNKRWYENIGVSGNVNFRNQIDTKDSLLFREPTLKGMRNGIQATASASTQFNLLKYFTFSPSINFTNRTYFSTINKYYDNAAQQLVTDTLFFWQDLRNIKNRSEFSVNGSFTTRLYGMFNFRRGPVAAIRHVITPSVNLSYRPDFSTQITGYYGPDGTLTSWSPYQIGIYGAPSVGRQGNVGMSLGNNIEMKVPDKNDTTGTGLRKVTLIEQLNISTSYNIAADSLRWAPININGRTTLFKVVGINFAANFDPYAAVNNKRINTTEWKANKRLLRLTGANLAINFSLRPKAKTAKKTLTPEEEKIMKQATANPDLFVDFDLPYNLTVNYNMNYNPAALGTALNPKVTQTFNFNGDVRISPKTKVGFTSGFDFINKELSFTSLDIYRDLHCWELSANWIPFGIRKSYTINVRVKASVLQDLKLQRRRAWQDLQ